MAATAGTIAGTATGMATRATRPETSEAASPIDHAHLARYTLGNRPLELEVLHLFADQAPLTLAELQAAGCAKSWHIAAHTLKGSARAVGAWALADAAEKAERAGPTDEQRSHRLRQLEMLVDELRRYIGELPVSND